MARWTNRTRRRYADRAAAGAALAAGLRTYAGRPDAIVVGLPRGGVPVAAAVADRLGARLDVLVVRKLGLPRHPEVAMGAIAGTADGVETVRNTTVIERSRVTGEEFGRVVDRELAELRHREETYRRSRSPLPVRGRVVLLVDDGLATGATMRVAARVIRTQGPARVAIVSPVGPPDVCAALAREADELLCPWQPADFVAVGAAYDDFGQISNDEVRRLLAARS